MYVYINLYLYVYWYMFMYVYMFEGSLIYLHIYVVALICLLKVLRFGNIYLRLLIDYVLKRVYCKCVLRD